MKLLVICPVPAEFNACREVLRMRELPPLAGCRGGRVAIGRMELTAVESGPAKARAAAATAAACEQHCPDLVVDTGSCAGLDPGSVIGQLVLATTTYEYDIGGAGIPTKNLAAMKLPAAFAHLDPTHAETLQREAVEIAGSKGLKVRTGPQACGEFLVQSTGFRRALHGLFRAAAANWESAGVFVAALRSGRPALSIRVVTDLGDEQALSDFRKHVKAEARKLYGYILELSQQGWFDRVVNGWGGQDPESRRLLRASVWP